MKAKQYLMLVAFEAPGEATQAEIKEFIQELGCAGGCRHPDDPLFDSLDKIEVLYLKRK